MEENKKEKRLYLITIIGKKVVNLIEDLENFSNNFLEKSTNIESFIKYGNSIYFVSTCEIEELSNNISNIMTNEFAFTLFDLTDSINIFDFRGNINDSHYNSKEFTEIIKTFSENYESEINEFDYHLIDKTFDSKRFQFVEEKTDKELLNEAIEIEDYETAAILRDKIIKSEM